MQRAKRLLDATVRAIALALGFGSLRRFHAVFVEVYGRAPTELRKQRRAPRH